MKASVPTVGEVVSDLPCNKQSLCASVGHGSPFEPSVSLLVDQVDGLEGPLPLVAHQAICLHRFQYD